MAERLTERQQIWRGLLQGQRAMLLRLGGELKRDFGLTIPQYEALLALYQSTGRALPATRLARELLYSSGSGSHLIARLSQRGYVHRSPGGEDARTQIVTLSEAGEDLIVRATEAHVAALRVEFDPLIADADVGVLLGFAHRLAEHEGVRPVPPVDGAQK
ncbi:MarR family winged helix-turn-helix transcriptional regulator [Agromyces italicus]|uniref:MarR family winged helix-turn-helix transcriptional regulator n=1 Tax=Agromyces italicus TaxID=279572 RepID=UPI0003B6C428|nr:MarR family transcriptional regulator [Agromyces italicus]